MKNKKIIIMIIVAVVLILGSIFAYLLYQNNDNNMDYKFENDKLYITVDSKEWIEVPFDFSYTIKHLNEEHKGKYEEGTYQLDNKKIVFYIEGINNPVEPQIYDDSGNAVLPTYKYVMAIVYSDDKGKTWNSEMIGTSDYRDMLVSINFDNAKNGKMTLKSRQNVGKFNYITQDGGKTWITEYDDEYELTKIISHYMDNLEDIPKQLTPLDAAERGYFVYDCIGDKVYNEDILKEFVKNTEMNAEDRISDEIIMVIYNMDGDPNIYNLGYKYNENMGYVLVKDYTRTSYMNALEDIEKIVIDTDIPSEYYGITIKDSGFSSEIISLTSYSETYEDIEIARYAKN